MDTGFEPRMEEADREKALKGWHRAVAAAQFWASHK